MVPPRFRTVISARRGSLIGQKKSISVVAQIAGKQSFASVPSDPICGRSEVAPVHRLPPGSGGDCGGPAVRRDVRRESPIISSLIGNLLDVTGKPPLARTHE